MFIFIFCKCFRLIRIITVENIKIKMEWNQSGIGPAIQAAKRSKLLFVVVIHGEDDDEDSKHFLTLLDDQSVTSLLNPDTCVALKIKNESESCKQFSALYPVVLVPSIYFIDSSNGVDVEVTGGGQITMERLLGSINKALGVVKVIPPASVANSDDILSPRASRVEQARQVIREATVGVAEPDVQEATNEKSDVNSVDKQSVPNEEAGSSSLSLEERVARAKELLAARREQKDVETESQSKNAEVERRQLGRHLQDFKRNQEEIEAKKAAEERKKDREETKLARERVKAQIEQDRLEKQAKFDVQKQQELDERREREKKALEEQVLQAERLAAARSTMARVQFRLPDGGARTHAFSADSPLSEVYGFVSAEMSESITFRGGFSLSTTFPTMLLDEKPMDMPLRELGLAPSKTVLVLPKSGSLVKSSGYGDGIMDYIWLLLTPLTVLWGILTSFVTPTSTPNTTSSNAYTLPTSNTGGSEGPSAGTQQQTRPKNSSFRNEGNIRRLHNVSGGEEDENNTWNGNSTQQQ